jgi:hypothetical protein
MSTPTTPATEIATVAAEARIRDARAYAAAVRAQLDDLTPDVVEELAGGLDADLADLAAESDQPLGMRLGDPARYAAELRAAADLPERRLPMQRAGLRSRLSAARSEQLRALQANPWWPTLASVGRDLRPVWWVLRAWVAWQLLHAMGIQRPIGGLPHSLAGWLSLLLLVAGSIALGRGLFRQWKAVGTLVAVGNGFALLMVPFALAWSTQDRPLDYYNYVESVPSTQDGLWLDGNQLTNLFPYGPDGEPLAGVTLLDQDGRPVELTWQGDGSIDANGHFSLQMPWRTADGDIRYNVFPQGSVWVSMDESGQFYDEFGKVVPPQDVEVDPAAPPRLRVPEIATGSTGSEPTPTATTGPTGPTSTAPPAQTTPPATTPPPTTP